jgi:hypothetical protein
MELTADIRPNRMIEHAVQTPSRSESVMNDRIRQVELACPLADGLPLPAPFQHVVVCLVGVLLDPCAPLAISGEVSEVGINPVKRVARWREPHVSHKVGKRHPFFTYRNSSASVVLVSLMLWVGASSLHALPDVVKATVGHSVLEFMPSPFRFHSTLNQDPALNSIPNIKWK